jgi:hypothetical protein
MDESRGARHWQREFENYGIVGLRAGYFQQYRSARPS